MLLFGFQNLKYLFFCIPRDFAIKVHKSIGFSCWQQTVNPKYVGLLGSWSTYLGLTFTRASAGRARRFSPPFRFLNCHLFFSLQIIGFPPFFCFTALSLFCWCVATETSHFWPKSRFVTNCLQNFAALRFYSAFMFFVSIFDFFFFFNCHKKTKKLCII